MTKMIWATPTGPRQPSSSRAGNFLFLAGFTIQDDAAERRWPNDAGVYAPAMDRPVNVGMLGCGNVGATFAEFLLGRAPDIQEISGIDLTLRRIAVRDAGKKRSGLLAPLITDDVRAITDAGDIDVVVEVMSGIEPAHAYVLAALRAGKSVVTANKELIAKHGPELYEAADASGVDLFFETAAVASVPILRVLRESFLGEDITSVLGIVNGTSNYMLTRMSEEGLGYSEALRQAQEEGYAEPDPTNDVTGADSASKLAILASLAFKRAIAVDDVEREGIDKLERDDFDIAARFGYVIKSIAKAEVFGAAGSGEREIGVQVFPALVDKNHPLANVRHTYNAVFLKGCAAGDQMFYGHGAGRLPSASALLGDLVTAADHLRRGTHRRVPLGSSAVLRPTERLAHPHYLKLEVTDAPGVLSEVSGVLGRHQVSIRSITQEDRASKARVVFITHRAEEGAMRQAVAELRSLDSVLGVGGMLRIVEA
ncbi:homoserine dehydrogenase [Micromonospora ureilytica]|uniref:homoserine dehydrogenase n=1 Tax=Micromonospora ureilytica TaxID=709868 RepID=UPI002E1034CD|nr:homoserine dehydrogenase [Micromonospora ureilytica]